MLRPYDGFVDAVFFAQVRDAVEGAVVPVGRDVRTAAHGRGVKVWFGDAVREHYEAQLIRVGDEIMLEIGFHSEHPDAARNDETLGHLVKQIALWRPGLGDEAEAGPFIGRRGWTRISECWEVPEATLDSAIDIAARLADYVTLLEPRRVRPSRPA